MIACNSLQEVSCNVGSAGIEIALIRLAEDVFLGKVENVIVHGHQGLECWKNRRYYVQDP